MKKQDYIAEIKAEDVFTVHEGRNYLGGKPLEGSELANIAIELDYITKTKFWSVLTETLTRTAQMKIFETAGARQTFPGIFEIDHTKIYEDQVFGKAMLYEIDQIRQLAALITKAAGQLPRADFGKPTKK